MRPSPLLIAAIALVAAASPACSKAPTAETGAAAAAAAIKTVTAEELAAQLKSAAPPRVFDANSETTRKEKGLIPGAVPLTSSAEYDVAATLPAQKADSLVFYCGGIKCKSAEGAAKRAVEAGYQNVAVLAVGIAGWKDAGQATVSL